MNLWSTKYSRFHHLTPDLHLNTELSVFMVKIAKMQGMSSVFLWYSTIVLNRLITAQWNVPAKCLILLHQSVNLVGKTLKGRDSLLSTVEPGQHMQNSFTMSCVLEAASSALLSPHRHMSQYMKSPQGVCGCASREVRMSAKHSDIQSQSHPSFKSATQIRRRSEWERRRSLVGCHIHLSKK